MADDLVSGRNALQLLGNIFSELAQLSAATRTRIVLGHVRDHFARKVFRKRLPSWTGCPGLRLGLLRTRLLRFSSCLICGLRRFQFFETKLQLLQLSGELLALAPEDHPPVLLDDQLQMLDLLRVRPQLLVLLDGLVMLRN